MSEEIMEALDSGTSSESESESIKSPLKDCESLSHRKLKIASQIANENSNSSSDLPLSFLVTKKKSQLSILSEDETDGSTSNTTEKQNEKPSNVLVSMDENSSSSDIPLTKLASNKKPLELKLEVPSSNVSVSADDNSCSSDVPLAKFVRSTIQHTNLEAKKVNNKLRKKVTVNKSKKSKSKLEVMMDGSNDSHASDQTSLVEQEESDSSSSFAQARETPKSNIKKQKSVKTKKVNEKSSLKRKRSEETSSEQKRAKTKRKLNISSDSSSDDAVKSKRDTPAPASSIKNGTPVSTTKNETVPAIIDSKSSPSMGKKKLGPASGKKKSPVQDDVMISPTKTEANTNPKGSNSKPIGGKKAKVLDKNGILEKLNNSSDTSSSSEDSEVEDPSNVETAVALPSSSSSESGEDSVTTLSSLKRKKKVPQKKAKGTRKSENVGNASDSDDPMVRKTSNSSTGKVEEHPVCSTSGSSSSEESENVSPQKKKATQKDEKSSKKETTKEKKIPGTPRIIRLQRYLKEAGIRVQNYKTLWQNCKNDKARAQKLMELLHERGLKGKPSVSECRKLKKKLEREKEVSELNTSNIITSNGRSRRGVTSLFATRHSPSPASAKKQETSPKKSPEFKKIFGRLKNIVDSEDSD
ncbi:LOW QUALITY PROTEIN: HIRA-interacting protein 3-like [Daphnia carinata]|uniref:LOW QUALITY PROTEIN: HIRA-interacting protein 3-like n=1 Tax=Daphnia carinata TaxID=120202 RepID=UPI0028695908|nr:LOW QUALITY PROTEIN: HIRA-interacting protein 3-like [Daphnia carinata]